MTPVPPRLHAVIAELGSVLVAYSGGVDSTYLAWAAHHVLGPRSRAVTADSPSLPRAELDDALTAAREAGFEVEIVHTDEFRREAYLRNAPDRCFHCKEALFDKIFPLASRLGLAHVALGTVTDDLGDVRPGLRSAERRGAKAPLVDAGLDKTTVRSLARRAGLRVWDKPQAACLSSRSPHGTPVTLEALERVERAEAAVRGLGFRVVRVRADGDGARVEVGSEELRGLADPARREEVVEAVGAQGYRVVVIDPRGYRPGGRLPVVAGPAVPD